jgi:hypothetical protein
MCVALAKHPMVDKYRLDALRCVFSGAAPLGEDTELQVRKRYVVVRRCVLLLVLTFAQTECGDQASIRNDRAIARLVCALLPERECRSR